MKSSKTVNRLNKTKGSVPAAGGPASQEINETETCSDWHLPSGKSLEQFALDGGYLAPLLIQTAGVHPERPAKIEGKRA